jgi:hypothetical protein
VFAPPVGAVTAILLIARVWQRYERRILAFGVLLSIVTLFAGCFAMGSIGGDDARLIIHNESSWPIEVTAEQPGGTRIVAPGQSTELVVYGGPGWANGLVIEPEIRGGPIARSSSVSWALLAKN